jgi:CheY-like chemotaxis protein
LATIGAHATLPRVRVAAAPLCIGEDEWPKASEEALPPRLEVVPGGRAGEEEPAQPSVLLVEDDASMRLLCTFNLELAGFRVAAVASGREGLEAAKANRFDLVLLDVMLPDLGGFELAAALRAAEVTRDVPLVFISARASGDDLGRGRAVGAIDYVTKPFDPVELGARLREDLEELARGGAEHVWQLRFGREPDR